MARSEKVKNLMALIAQHVDSGDYLDTRHSTQRGLERQITRPEILQVLKDGYHEKKKDKFDEHYEAWNYAVRGKTKDKRELRIVVSFDPNGMLIITAIELMR